MQVKSFFKKLFRNDVKFFSGDYTLWVIILLLCLISLTVIYSATVALAQKESKDVIYYLFGQFKVMAVCACGIWFISTIVSPNWISRHARFLMYVALFFSMMVFTGIGVEHNEARRWVTLGFISFNPFDILRVTLILDLAYQLTLKRDVIYKLRLVPSLFKWFSPEQRKVNIKILKETTLPILWPSLLGVAIVVKENGSTALIMCAMIVVMLMLGKVRGKQLWNIMGYGLVLLVLLIAAFSIFDTGRFDTMYNRIFPPKIEYEYNPDVPIEKQEINAILKANDKKNPAYQKTLAKMAVSTGGLTGKGPGHSTLRSKLPNSYDDCVYAIIVEEYGLVGGALVLFLYVIILFRGIKIAMTTKYYSLRLICLGLVFHIVLTAFIHMMVSTGNIATTGQTLPMISRGGSSIFANSFAFSIILSISKKKKKSQLEQPEQIEKDENNN